MPIFCFVTDRRMYAGDERAALARLLDAIGAAARAGVDLIQIRERDLQDRALLPLVRGALGRVAGTRARVLVNDRVDVAIASDAHGVHLRGDSIPAGRVRALAPSLVVGRSVHAVEDAAAAAREGGCEYLLAGTVFPSPSKPDGVAPIGVEGLQRMCRAVALPVLAIGGMTAERAPDAARAGAAGVAGIRIFADPSTVAETVDRLRRSFDT